MIASHVEPTVPDYRRRAIARDALWRQPSFARNALIGIGVLALLLNLVWVAGLRSVMYSRATSELLAQPIQVNVIEPPAQFEVPPEPVPAVFARRPSRVQIAPPETRMTPPPVTSESSSATTARIGAAGQPAPQLFNADGSLRLPEASIRIGPQQAPENPQAAAQARWDEIRVRGENPLDCERTRFAGAFARDESAGDKVARKYLSWIGLADQAGIAERAAAREGRAADGCDPPSK